MLQPGYMSKVELHSHRIVKYINCLNAYDEFVTLYAEYKILKYISALSTSFPQNVENHGPLGLSYDYISGLLLKDCIDSMSMTEKYNILNQVIKLYIILAEADFFHGKQSQPGTSLACLRRP